MVFARNNHSLVLSEGWQNEIFSHDVATARLELRGTGVRRWYVEGRVKRVGGGDEGGRGVGWSGRGKDGEWG